MDESKLDEEIQALGRTSLPKMITKFVIAVGSTDTKAGEKETTVMRDADVDARCCILHYAHGSSAQPINCKIPRQPAEPWRDSEGVKILL